MIIRIVLAAALAAPCRPARRPRLPGWKSNELRQAVRGSGQAQRRHHHHGEQGMPEL